MMEWLKQFNDAIAYIEAHLDGEISYEEAARIACCSTCYFQRLFTYIVGISPAEYIRRRRMTQAAFEIQRTGKRIMEIGLKYGYTSPTAFNRAFQSVHGMPPTMARKPEVTLQAYPAVHLSVSVSGEHALAYHITEKPAMRIVGCRIPLTEEMEENQKRIPQFWKQMWDNPDFPDLLPSSSQGLEGLYGISVYESPQNFYYYIATATEEPVPEGLFEYHIPASKWVIFENQGSFQEEVQTVFRSFFTEWLPFSGYRYAGLPDIEWYPYGDGQIISGHSEVWIAVAEKEDKHASFTVSGEPL